MVHLTLTFFRTTEHPSIMTQTLIKPNNGAVLSAELVDALRATVLGNVIVPGDPRYNEARSIWNAMIDRRPALIVQCTGNVDVVHTLAFARKHQLAITVRGGGHNIAGSAIADGSLLIDLSQMSTVRVDPANKRVHVAPGA